MRITQRLARATVLASNRLGATTIARHAPVRQVSAVLANRVVPALTKRVFRPGFQHVNGVRLLIPAGAGAGGEYHMAVGTYESSEIQFVLSQLPTAGGFVDVGAHIGYFSLAAAARVGPDGHIIAFEPTPASATLLRQNIAENQFEDRVVVIEAAASSEAGEGTFYTSGTSDMWNTLEPDTLEPDAASITVKTTTVDRVLADVGWPTVHVLKMDVEGHESHVLQGSQETLARYPDLAIIFEASGTSDERLDVSTDTIRFLESAGFGFSFLEPRGRTRSADVSQLIERMRRPRWQDALFNVVARRQNGSNATR
jgi:FkbM family methyltransferase